MVMIPHDKPKATASSGDSGTPFMKDPNTVFGVMQGQTFIRDANKVSYLTFYMPEIVKDIGRVVAPSQMNLKYQAGEVELFTKTFAIQNLSPNTESIAPTLKFDNNTYPQEITDGISISGCEIGTLNTEEYCQLAIAIEGKAQDISFQIELNDSRNRVIDVSYVDADIGGGDGNEVAKETVTKVAKETVTKVAKETVTKVAKETVMKEILHRVARRVAELD